MSKWRTVDSEHVDVTTLWLLSLTGIVSMGILAARNCHTNNSVPKENVKVARCERQTRWSHDTLNFSRWLELFQWQFWSSEIAIQTIQSTELICGVGRKLTWIVSMGILAARNCHTNNSIQVIDMWGMSVNAYIILAKFLFPTYITTCWVR